MTRLYLQHKLPQFRELASWKQTNRRTEDLLLLSRSVMSNSFATPCTAARQASLSFTISRSLLNLALMKLTPDYLTTNQSEECPRADYSPHNTSPAPPPTFKSREGVQAFCVLATWTPCLAPYDVLRLPPVVKTLLFHCRRHRLKPWLGS